MSYITLRNLFGTKKIDIELLVVAGGGGGNYTVGTLYSPSPTVRFIDIPRLGAGGGGGGVFYGVIPIDPGSTCPVVVGGGGAGTSGLWPGTGSVIFNTASNGSPSIFSAPTIRYESFGGGAGGGLLGPGNPGFTILNGVSGGSGGGSPGASAPGIPSVGYTLHAYGPYTNQSQIPFGGGAYYGNNGYEGSPGPLGPGNGSGGYGGSSALVTTIAGITTMYGVGGVGGISPTNPAAPERRGYVPAPAQQNTGHGGNGIGPLGATPLPAAVAPSGAPGVVIVRYPTSLSAAPAFPGATDISPSTPGYRTYRFTSPGSITLP